MLLTSKRTIIMDSEKEAAEKKAKDEREKKEAEVLCRKHLSISAGAH